VNLVDGREKIENTSGTPKVLIADDEKDLVDLVSYHLRKKGFETLSAFDGSEAWSVILSERPVLTILDLMMPKGEHLLHFASDPRAVQEKGGDQSAQPKCKGAVTQL
jgi:CheY-like chemotaxis protein